VESPTFLITLLRHLNTEVSLFLISKTFAIAGSNVDFVQKLPAVHSVWPYKFSAVHYNSGKIRYLSAITISICNNRVSQKTVCLILSFLKCLSKIHSLLIHS